VLAAIAALQLETRREIIAFFRIFEFFFSGKPPCSKATFYRSPKNYSKSVNKKLGFSVVIQDVDARTFFCLKLMICLLYGSKIK